MTNARGNTKDCIAEDASAFFPDDDFIEALSEHVEKEIITNFNQTLGNQFEAYLGKGFVDDLKGTLTGKVEIMNNTALTIKCLDGNVLTFVIIPKEQCIEAFSPKANVQDKLARHRRVGILSPKFSYMWKAFITLTFAQYNSKIL